MTDGWAAAAADVPRRADGVQAGLCRKCAATVRKVEANDFTPPTPFLWQLFELKTDEENALRDRWLNVRPLIIADAWKLVRRPPRPRRVKRSWS